MTQSIHARQPSRIGDPFDDACHATPANLSPPLTAKPRDSSSWSWERMFAQKRPVSRIRGHDVDVFAGAKNTYGGSSDSELNDCTAIPTGSSPSIDVMMATPLPKWPRTLRKCVESIAGVSRPVA